MNLTHDFFGLKKNAEMTRAMVNLKRVQLAEVLQLTTPTTPFSTHSTIPFELFVELFDYHLASFFSESRIVTQSNSNPFQSQSTVNEDFVSCSLLVYPLTIRDNNIG